MGGKNGKPASPKKDIAAAASASRTVGAADSPPRTAQSDPNKWLSPSAVKRLVKEVLASQGTKFSETSEHVIAIWNVEGETATMIFDFHESNDCLSIYFLLQRRVPPVALRSPGGMTEFLARANYGLRYGFFDLSEDHIRYTFSTDLSDLRRNIAASKVGKMVKIIHSTFKRYLPGILGVFVGHDPSNMCFKVERSGWEHESVDEAKHFGITCDGCKASDFAGKAYVCETCTDYHLCNECFTRQRTSKGHSSSHRVSEHPLPKHRGIVCDYCFAEEFYVPRYKCDVCHDYDLCQKCFRDGKTSQSHAASHPMTRFNQPKMRNSGGGGGGGGGGGNMGGGMAQSPPARAPISDSMGSIASRGSTGSGGREDRIDPQHLVFDRTNHRNLLGRGGMGEVWRGEYNLAPVAVKLVLSDVSSNAERTERFKEEYCLHIGLMHPNIVQVLGWCMKDDVLCLVAEFCGKGSLNKVLERESDMPHGQRVQLALGAAAGMHYLHSRNILHLDLKPDNLFVTDANVVKVGDFGLSQALQAKTHASNVNAGTLLYMAPELLQEGSRATKKTDCYAFSLVLFEIFIGQPYSGESLDFRFIMQMVQLNRRPRIYKSIDPNLERLITELWDTNPDRRPEFMESHGRLKSCT